MDTEPEEELDPDAIEWLTLRHRDRVARQQRENLRPFLGAPIACAAVVIAFMMLWSVRTDHQVTRACKSQPAACYEGVAP